MELYHTSFGKLPDGVCSHFGTVQQGLNLLDGMFAAKNVRMFDGKRCQVFKSQDNAHRASGFLTLSHFETPQESLIQFAKFVAGANIYKVDAVIANPLRLTDLWGDDPIGSGGPAILGNDTALSQDQRTQLTALFHPFRDVIYPAHVAALLPSNEINRRKAEVLGDGFFGEQLQARKRKLGAAAYAQDEHAEVVWMHLTMKLREWSLKNGYDSFVYSNTAEGKGEESHVTLKQGSAKAIETLRIDHDAFLETGLPRIESHMAKVYQRSMQNKRTAEQMRFCDVVDMSQFLIPSSPNDLGSRQSPLQKIRPGFL